MSSSNERIPLSLAGHVDHPDVAAVLLRASGTPRDPPRLQTGLSYAQGVALAKNSGVAVAKVLAESATDAALLEHLAKDHRKAVQSAVISNPHTPATALETLAARALNRADGRDTAYEAMQRMPTGMYIDFQKAHALVPPTSTHEVHASHAAGRGAEELRLALYSGIPPLAAAAAHKMHAVVDDPPSLVEIEERTPDLIAHVFLGYMQGNCRHAAGHAWTEADAQSLVRARRDVTALLKSPPSTRRHGVPTGVQPQRLPLSADAARVLWNSGHDFFRTCVTKSRAARNGEIVRLIIEDGDPRHLRTWVARHVARADSYLLHRVLRAAMEGGLERESALEARHASSPAAYPLGRGLSELLWTKDAWFEDDVLIPLLAYAKPDHVRAWLSGKAQQRPEPGQISRVAALRAALPEPHRKETWSSVVSPCDAQWSVQPWAAETVNTFRASDLDSHNRYSESNMSRAFANLVTYYLGDQAEAWQTMLTLINGWTGDLVSLLEAVCATLGESAPPAPWATPPRDPPVQLTVEANGQIALLL